MNLKLYSSLGSAAVRGTLLTIRALGLKDKVKIINIDLSKLDQFKPEFIQKNPLCTVPVLEDGNFILWDSHAINAYLVNKYGENDYLYPKDPQKRALVDCMNNFDTGYLFARGVKIQKAVFQLDKSVDLEKLQKEVVEALDMLNIILAERQYVAGEELSIADFSMVATFSTIEICLPLDNEKHSHIARWYKTMKQLPYYNINQKGIDIFLSVFGSLLSKL